MSKQEEKKPSGQEKEEVKKGSKEAALAEEILSEEDQTLKEKLELLVTRLSDKDIAQRENALN
jgi:hypothetical protein